MWKQKLEKSLFSHRDTTISSIRFKQKVSSPLLSPFSRISLKCMDRVRPWMHWRSSCIRTRTLRSILPCAPALLPYKETKKRNNWIFHWILINRSCSTFIYHDIVIITWVETCAQTQRHLFKLQIFHNLVWNTRKHLRNYYR